MDRATLTTELDPTINIRFRKDVAEAGVTMGTYLDVALSTFMRMPKSERHLRFVNVRKKIFGRKLKEAA